MKKKNKNGERGKEGGREEERRGEDKKWGKEGGEEGAKKSDVIYKATISRCLTALQIQDPYTEINCIFIN